MLPSPLARFFRTPLSHGRLRPAGLGGLAALTVFTVSFSVSGCFGELNVGEDAQLRCDVDDDCPAPTTCLVAARLCVLPGVEIDTTPPLVVSSAVSATRLGSGQEATITITMDDDVTVSTVTVEGNEDAALEGTAAAEVVSVVVAADEVGSGRVVLLVAVADLAGNTNTVRVDAGLVVDVDAPELAADVLVIATSRNNVLFPGNAAAARDDSTVDVDAIFTEALASVDALTVGGVALDAADVDIDGTRIAFSIAGEVLASLDDGDLAIAVEVSDDVGNSNAVTLSSTLRKDTTAPPVPEFQILRRAPFGAETARVQTQAEGTALEAVLILALPEGVDVDPATIPSNVAREPVDEDATFNVSVGIDIPGLRVVAVDEAGNLSGAASAARIELVASVAQAASPHALMERPVVAEHLVQRGDRRIDNFLRADGERRSVPTPFFRPHTTVQAAAMSGLPLVAEDPIGGGVIAIAGGQTFRVVDNQVIRLDVIGTPARARGGMSTDTDRGVIVVFGGEDGTGGAQNGLFEFDGERWTEVLRHNPAATDRPRPRIGHGMGYVEGLGVVVSGGCGGEDFNINNSGCDISIPYDLWAWDGTTFTELCAGAGCGSPAAEQIGASLVDHDGDLVAFGGSPNELLGFLNPSVPQIRRFVDGAFVGSCTGDCALALPFNGVLQSVDGELVIVGNCNDGPCRVVVDGETTTKTSLRGLNFPNLPDPFQHRVLVNDGRQDLVVKGSGQFVAVSSSTVFNAVPSAMNPRAHGGLVGVDGELQLMAGCSNGGAGPPPGDCSVGISTLESVASPGVVLEADVGVTGAIQVVDVGTDSLVLHRGQEADRRGFVEVRSLATLTAPPVVVPIEEGIPLELGEDPTGGLVTAAFSSGTDGRAIVAWGFSRNELSDAPTNLTIDGTSFLTAGGLDGVACASGCGIVGVVPSVGVAFAPIRDGGGLLMGGQRGVSPTPQTILVDEAGQGTTLATAGPPPRSFASAVFDPEREVTWLSGGTAVDFNSGNFQDPCGGPDQPEDCNDLWRFDGEAWTQITPVDIVGIGVPPGRAGAQIGSLGGGFTISGGVAGRFGTPKTDAWSLEASSTTTATHQLLARYSPYGDDAAGDLTDLKVQWCGVAQDALGGAVAVDVRVWIGGGWRSMAVVEGAASCVDATLDSAGLDGVADRVQRGVSQEVIVEVVPQLSRAGRDDPSITTTAFTVTTAYAP